MSRSLLCGLLLVWSGVLVTANELGRLWTIQDQQNFMAGSWKGLVYPSFVDGAYSVELFLFEDGHYSCHVVGDDTLVYKSPNWELSCFYAGLDEESDWKVWRMVNLTTGEIVIRGSSSLFSTGAFRLMRLNRNHMQIEVWNYQFDTEPLVMMLNRSNDEIVPCEADPYCGGNGICNYTTGVCHYTFDDGPIPESFVLTKHHHASNLFPYVLCGVGVILCCMACCCACRKYKQKCRARCQKTACSAGYTKLATTPTEQCSRATQTTAASVQMKDVSIQVQVPSAPVVPLSINNNNPVMPFPVAGPQPPMFFSYFPPNNNVAMPHPPAGMPPPAGPQPPFMYFYAAPPGVQPPSTQPPRQQ